MSPPIPAPSPAPLQIADSSFEAGDYRSAARAYEEHLAAGRGLTQQDRPLFRLALAYALQATQAVDLSKAIPLLRRVVVEFPKSPYRAEAEFILSLFSEVEKLRLSVKETEERVRRLASELDRLKKIDMDRRPTRPPE